jgi:hypothetical protein
MRAKMSTVQKKLIDSVILNFLKFSAGKFVHMI